MYSVLKDTHTRTHLHAGVYLVCLMEMNGWMFRKNFTIWSFGCKKKGRTNERISNKFIDPTIDLARQQWPAVTIVVNINTNNDFKFHKVRFRMKSDEKTHLINVNKSIQAKQTGGFWLLSHSSHLFLSSYHRCNVTSWIYFIYNLPFHPTGPFFTPKLIFYYNLIILKWYFGWLLYRTIW